MRSLVSALLLLGVLACGPGVEPAHLLYSEDPQSLENPFPDLRLLENGRLTFRANWYLPFLPTKAQTAPVRALFERWATNEITGVGNFGATLLRPSVPVDPASLEGIASRLMKTDEGYAVLEENVRVESGRVAFVGTNQSAPDDFPEFLVVQPAVPLPEDREGLLVIRQGLRAADGAALGRGFAFDRSLDRAQLSGAAKALGIAEKEILLALPLRPQKTRAPMLALAEWSSARTPAFTLPPKGVVDSAPLGIWRSTDANWSQLSPWLRKFSWAGQAADVGTVVIGSFEAKDLRDEHGLWKSEWVNAPESAPTVPLQFVLTLPKGDKPAGGWRVVIGAHGINNRNLPVAGNGNAFCLEVAQLLASRGMGCLGIDATSHGTRGTALKLFSMENIAITRDHFRQMVVDHFQLSRLAQVLDVDGGGPDLNPELGLFGNSLGGIMSASSFALDARMRYGVLNVPGGGLTNILNSVQLRDSLGLLLVAQTQLAYTSPEYFGTFPVLRAMAQLILETGDPINLAVGVERKPVLIQESLVDLTIPNSTTRELARVYGTELTAAPQSGTAPVRAHVQADPERLLPGRIANGYDSHNLFWDAAPVRDQMLRFLETRGTDLLVE